jgi:hypothetical protein
MTTGEHRPQHLCFVRIVGGHGTEELLQLVHGDVGGQARHLDAVVMNGDGVAVCLRGEARCMAQGRLAAPGGSGQSNLRRTGRQKRQTHRCMGGLRRAWEHVHQCWQAAHAHHVHVHT